MEKTIRHTVTLATIFMLVSALSPSAQAQESEPVRGPRLRKRFAGLRVERFPDGVKKAEYECVDGKADGTWTSWDPQGKKTAVVVHKKDRLHNPAVFYHPDGAKRSA